MSKTSDIAIHVKNLSKEFRLYTHPSDLLVEMLRGKPRYRSFWALRDVSFDVHRGQVVGIVGQNGAGKSTLLKIITGTLDKTSGEVITNGRISSILELGTGFSGEYSGRENIYLGGLMVGLSRKEILAREDWIIEFSELANFIDQPFKTFSTGMQARLTFATAVSIDPDILIIDEALAVGDERFQRKSFGKIQEIRETGRTILLVSHNMSTITSFCDHAILLENGQIFDQGSPHHIGKVYGNILLAKDEMIKVNQIKSLAVEENETIAEIALDPSNMKRAKGLGWQINLSNWNIRGDVNDAPRQSKYVLYEDDEQMPLAHTEHDRIFEIGKGMYSHWGSQLYFSTSDNSDPRKNGHVYTLKHKSLISNSDDEPVADVLINRTTLKKNALQMLSFHKLMAPVDSVGEGITDKKQAEIVDFGILNELGQRQDQLVSGGKYIIFSRTLFYENLESVVAGFVIRDRKGTDMFGTNSFLQNARIQPMQTGQILEVDFEVLMHLTNGIYFLSISITDQAGSEYDTRYDAMQFEVAQKNGIYTASIVDLDAAFLYKELTSLLR